MNELKPCPFCGGKPYKAPKFTMGYGGYGVKCECGCETPKYLVDEKAISWWNGRAEVPQWIPVSERLPENEGTYFCLGHNGTPFVCLFRTTKYEGKIWLRSTGTKRVYGITHWMPLPAAPEQNK